MAVGHWNESVVDLIPQYRAARRGLQKLREKTKDAADREIISSMLGDVEFALQWLETGRNPKSLKGVERRYERPWAPEWLDRYHSPYGWSIERETITAGLTDDDRFRIEEAMRDLTMRERQCFVMHVVDGMSFGEIARELHLAKGAVQVYVERARQKIEIAKNTSLFLV